MVDVPIKSLTAIADRQGSLAAFQMLKESFQKDAQIFSDHSIGWQGGTSRHRVYWLDKFRVWAVLDPVREGPRPRFSNLFGVHSPAEHQMLKITVEINPPMRGKIGASRGCSRKTQTTAST